MSGRLKEGADLGIKVREKGEGGRGRYGGVDTITKGDNCKPRRKQLRVSPRRTKLGYCLYHILLAWPQENMFHHDPPQ